LYSEDHWDEEPDAADWRAAAYERAAVQPCTPADPGVGWTHFHMSHPTAPLDARCLSSEPVAR
jgi:hypothetical protein